MSSDSSNNSKKVINLVAALCRGFKRTVTVDDETEKQHKSSAIESAERPPHLLVGVESLRSQDFIPFKSRSLTYNQLFESLECNYRIGLYGVKGIGKTTLAKEVIVKLYDESIKFDHIIFITVSKVSHMKEIQDIIAGELGVTLKEENEWERTETIMKRLRNGERVLLILDDVKENINIQELGFPFRDNCKVLVISYSKILCNSMGCKRLIQLEKLSKGDAWMLFKKHVGISDNSSLDVQHMGRKITKACEGLPNKIVVTASVLKGRPLEDWVKIFITLEKDRYDEGLIKAYAVLKFSHDDSNVKKAQSLCFLLCMFPQNIQVSIEMLVRLGTGMGIFGETEKYSDLRSEVLKIKSILIDSCVCFEDEGGDVRMNDLIWRMSRNNEFELCRIRQSKNKWVFSTIENNIHYLYYNDLLVEELEMDLLPNGCECTKVEMLLINVEASNYVEVLDAFFEKMTRLKVMSLSSNNFHPTIALKLPSSLRSLTNIRSLILSHWKLGDISILGVLQSLDTLDFDDCSLYEFPKAISTLKLRLLSLKRCQIERNNPFEVIERCLSLQELYYKDNKVSILDGINEAEENVQSGTFLTLNRYNLQGGKDSTSKCVCLPNIDVLISEAAFKYLVRGAQILHLKEMKRGWRNLIPEIVPMGDECMGDLVELGLESCLKVECLVNTQHNKSSVFSKLGELKLSNMDSLKELCIGDIPLDFLESLKSISIEHCAHLQGILFKKNTNLSHLKSVNLIDCQQLTFIFQLSIVQSLALLEELRIGECKLLTNIIEDGNGPKSNVLIFPKLKTLEVEGCDQLECILPLTFPRDIMLLQNLKISKCPKLKYIFYEEEDIPMSLQKVELCDMSNFFNISIESYSLFKRSSSRNYFKAKQKQYATKLRSASSIKILEEEEDGVNDHQISLISSSKSPPPQSQGLNILVVRNIKQLVLKDLHKIKYLFTLSTASSMMLEILIIDSCRELKHIIDIGDGREGKNFDVLLKLKELSISWCIELECMFGLMGDQNFNEIHIHLPSLKKLNLQNLLKFSISSMTWIYLKEFVLVQCPDFSVNPISNMMIHLDSNKLVRTTIEDIREMDKHFLSLETLTIENYKAENIFCVSGVKIIGQVRLGLQCLQLRNLPSMLYICVGPLSSFIFQNLNKIQITGCSKLRVLFPTSVLRYLPELEVLEIQDCNELKQIIEKDTDLKNNLLSPKPCFPKLEVLVVKDCYNLKCLIHESSDVPKVKTIRIERCAMLQVMFTASNNLRYLPELKNLEIKQCWGLEKITEEDHINFLQPCFPKLEVLVIKECYSLKNLINASNDAPNIQKIRIEGCAMLQVMFPSSNNSRFLPELKHLEIKQCRGLEKITEEDHRNSLQPLFPKLEVLVVNECSYLKSMINVPNLELLIIIGANELQVLMEGGEPRLKVLICSQLSRATLKQRILLKNIRHCFVHNCPKLSLKPTATFKEIKEKVLHEFDIDLQILLSEQHYKELVQVDEIVQSNVAQTVSWNYLPPSKLGLHKMCWLFVFATVFICGMLVVAREMMIVFAGS
ncbi:unnamed protein product [Lupinus luteus]|uniref:NB-ARC domain-containing protein n=1 Tax=Lupinus luteus TaxID=3873 RepID=A0AAV1W5B8_LUPLU